MKNISFSSALAIAGLMLPLVSTLNAQTIFYDDFTGDAGNLNGRTPTTTTGGETWFSDAFVLSGSGTTTIGEANTTFLDWSPMAGNIYELSVDMTASGSATSSTYGGFGFFNSKGGTGELSGNAFPVGTSPTTPWAFVRTGNSTAGLIGDSYLRALGVDGEQVFDTNYTVTDTLNLKLILNTNDTDAGTSGDQFSISFFVNDVQLGTTFTYSETESSALLSNINHVGLTFGGSGNSVSFDNFYLATVPEPGTFALLAGASMLGLVMLRRRR